MTARVSAIGMDYRHPVTAFSPTTALRSSPTTFQDLLDRMQAPATPAKTAPVEYTVRAGDTLSAICGRTLRQLGMAPSRQDIVEAIRLVAQTNRLADANRIVAGQKLDLSPLQAAPELPASAQAVSAKLEMPPNDELTALIQSLVARRTASAPIQPVKGILDGPLQISSGYGMRADPFTGAREWHAGIDLTANTGSAIHPLKSGWVVFSGWHAGYGNTVIVRHADGVQTLYAHNQKNLVRKGDRVTETTLIAKVGSTGRATGPHVHFEVRRDGIAVDPASYLSAASIQIAKAT